jgi:hypothetical protein
MSTETEFPFELDIDGVSDVTPGEQLARSAKSGEVESFPARLGVRYEHEHLAYWVSVEDVEGCTNGLWIETGAFTAMCERTLGGEGATIAAEATSSARTVVAEWDALAAEYADLPDDVNPAESDRAFERDQAQLELAPRLAEALRALTGGGS